jgi:hypothetical protein
MVGMGEEKVIAAFFYVVAVGVGLLGPLNVIFYCTQNCTLDASPLSMGSRDVQCHWCCLLDNRSPI